MKRLDVMAAVLSAGLGITLAGGALAFGGSGAKQVTAPPPDYIGQWYISGGCAYSRAQAPGYRVHWVLILNPHHLGQGPAPKHCPYRL